MIDKQIQKIDENTLLEIQNQLFILGSLEGVHAPRKLQMENNKKQLPIYKLVSNDQSNSLVF